MVKTSCLTLSTLWQKHRKSSSLNVSFDFHAFFDFVWLSGKVWVAGSKTWGLGLGLLNKLTIRPSIIGKWPDIKLSAEE